MLGNSRHELIQVARPAHGTSRNRHQLHDDDRAQRNRKMRGLQRIFVGLQQRSNNLNEFSNATNAVNNSSNRAHRRRHRICKRLQHSHGAGQQFRCELYSNRSGVLGLATETDFHSFTLNYTRQINPNLSVSGLIGLVGVTSGFSLGLPKTLLPIYTMSGTWTLTPKLSLNASASRSISPPTTVIANAQQSYNAGMNLSYQLTPKVAISAGGSVDYSTTSFTSSTAATGLSPFFF